MSFRDKLFKLTKQRHYTKLDLKKAIELEEANSISIQFIECYRDSSQHIEDKQVAFNDEEYNIDNDKMCYIQDVENGIYSISISGRWNLYSSIEEYKQSPYNGSLNQIEITDDKKDIIIYCSYNSTA